MNWIKKGLIYSPNGSAENWKNNSVLTPTPFLLNEEVIRIYCSFRDISGIGRIGYIDVEAKNPKKILKISDEPVISLGTSGMFDDHGMILGDVLKVKDKIYMYYVAFQMVKNVKFYAFSGLALSNDNGDTFMRIKQAPVMDRTEEGLYGRCIHSVIYEKNIFRVWYSVIYDWTYINNIPYPTYDIKYIESQDGINFADKGIECIKCNANEYRIGRPRVRRISDRLYEMRYTSDTFDKQYKSGYAESEDGINWIRKDCQSVITASHDYGSWDSDMACYPTVIETKYGTYMFYDGNGMGKDGFGFAVLEE